MNFQAVIYDMDGLLIDSENPFRQCDIDFLAKRGIEYEHSIEAHLKGNSMIQGSRWLKEYFKLTESVEELLKERLEMTEEIYRSIATLHKGVKEIVDKTKNSPAKTAIASGNTLDRVNMIVNRFNWQHHFDELVSSDHVNFVGKPSPDIYLYTAKKLGIKPENCIVFEDAPNGVVSAKAAGMTCIAVREVEADDLSTADLIVNNIQDPRVYSMLGLT